MRLLVKTNGQIPARANPLDAGFDLCASERAIIAMGRVTPVHTGVYVQPEADDRMYWIEVRGRSSLAKKGYMIHNGTIDAGYRGEIIVLMWSLLDTLVVEPGDRIAQLVVHELHNVDIIKAQVLDESVRGAGGFGSTGKR